MSQDGQSVDSGQHASDHDNAVGQHAKRAQFGWITQRTQTDDAVKAWINRAIGVQPRQVRGGLAVEAGEIAATSTLPSS